MKKSVASSKLFAEPDMTLIRERHVPVIVRWICPAEGCNGEMAVYKRTLTAKYSHACNNCGFTATAFRQYPRIEYESVKEASG